MPSGWKWRFGIMVGSALLALYMLSPTLLGLNAKRQQLESQGLPLPGYFKFLPDKQIKLGLDLQGGIHLVLGVDVEKAVADELNVLSSEIRDDLEKKGYGVGASEPVKGEQAIHVSFKSKEPGKPLDAALSSEIRKYLKERYPRMLFVPDADGAGVRVSFKKEELNYWKKNAVEQALQVLRNRIDQFGVNEPNITAQGGERILVQLPGIQDPARAKELVGRTARLTFQLVEDKEEVLAPVVKALGKLPEGITVEYEQTRFGERPYLKSGDRASLVKLLEHKLPETHQLSVEEKVNRQTLAKTYRTYILQSKVLLTGDMLADARVQIDPEKNKPTVGLRFNGKGIDLFKNVTTEHVGDRLAIVLDGNVNSAPSIRTPIPNGQAQIELNDNIDSSELAREAHDLAIVLRAGGLKAPIEILEDRTIGPTLGQDSIHHGMLAVIVGISAVIIFMAIYYRSSGLIADMALLLNGLFIMATMVLFQATLTLPGIAGLILTMGISVDVNVVIYERIREELRAGREVRAAVMQGFDRAWATVFDSNVTTALAGVVLLQFGTGPVKGFAVTLLIGILFSFLTGVYCTKIVFEWLTAGRHVKSFSI